MLFFSAGGILAFRPLPLRGQGQVSFPGAAASSVDGICTDCNRFTVTVTCMMDLCLGRSYIFYLYIHHRYIYIYIYIIYISYIYIYISYIYINILSGSQVSASGGVGWGILTSCSWYVDGRGGAC